MVLFLPTFPPFSGSMFVIGRLDYEITPEYLVTVSVTDRAPPYHEATAKVLNTAVFGILDIKINHDLKKRDFVVNETKAAVF